MVGSRILILLVLLIGSTGLSAQQEGAASVNLDEWISWDSSVVLDVKRLVPSSDEAQGVLPFLKRPIPQGEDFYWAQSSERQMAVKIFGGDLQVTSISTQILEGEVRYWMVRMMSPGNVVAAHDFVLARLEQEMGKPLPGKMSIGNSKFRPVMQWMREGVTLTVWEMEAGVVCLTGRVSPVSAGVKSMVAVPVSLDPLLNFENVWTWTSTDLEKRFVAAGNPEKSAMPQFEWLSAARDRARFARRLTVGVPTKLTLFAGSIQVEEATLEYVNGRVARATLSFYNRGDSGDIHPDDFDHRFKQIGRNLSELFKVAPRNQLLSANAALKVTGWNWTTPTGIALLEYDDYRANRTEPSFLRLKISAPNQADWSMGRLSVGVQRMALVKNVIRAPNGDVYIQNVPMVDQGAKGYCVAASCQRLFEYMNIPCDQHEMARLVNVKASSGADIFSMQKNLAKIDGHFKVTFKPLVNPELYYDSRRRRRVSLKEFVGLVKEYGDKGIPLLWALALGQYAEEPPLPVTGQTVGGHMRLVIGYNSAQSQILFTDSWGAGHELKRMRIDEAYEVTMGLYSMSPRGL